MYDYFKPLLKKVPGICRYYVIVLMNLLITSSIKLKQCINKSLLESKIIILNVTERLNNGKAVLSVKRSKEHFCSLEIDTVDNSNIANYSLVKRSYI